MATRQDMAVVAMDGMVFLPAIQPVAVAEAQAAELADQMPGTGWMVIPVTLFLTEPEETP